MEKWTVIEDGSVTSPQGFVAGAAVTGMKKSGAFDVTLIVSDRDCAAGGLFTRSQVVAAPVIVDREVLAANAARIRGVVANSKNANACTGQPGLDAARLTQSQAAAILTCEPEQLFVLSTGVIGEQLPLEKIGQGIEISALNLGSRPAKRSDTRAIGNLRAIPWTFSWNQARILLPSWYGAGSGVDAYCAAHPQGRDKAIGRLKTMYKRWPYFRAVIDNLEQVLVKTDLKLRIWGSYLQPLMYRLKIFCMKQNLRTRVKMRYSRPSF